MSSQRGRLFMPVCVVCQKIFLMDDPVPLGEAQRIATEHQRIYHHETVVYGAEKRRRSGRSVLSPRSEEK